MSVADLVTIPQLPFPLVRTAHEAAGGVWTVEPSGRVVGQAPPGSDLYVDPARERTTSEDPLPRAPMLLGTPPDGPFQLQARVAVDFRATFDAGVLVVHLDETTWAKLCFEGSPSGSPMVVSVVTRGVSDDANGPVVEQEWIHLRVSRSDGVYAFHSSTDGERWDLVRVFSLGPDVSGHRVGFEVQSPTGAGCTVGFDDIRCSTERLEDLRDGS